MIEFYDQDGPLGLAAVHDGRIVADEVAAPIAQAWLRDGGTVGAFEDAADGWSNGYLWARRVKDKPAAIAELPPVDAGPPLTAAARPGDDGPGPDRDDILAAVQQASLAYANAVADTVPVDPRDKRPGYAAYHHLFSAPPGVERGWLDVADELLAGIPKPPIGDGVLCALPAPPEGGSE